jgi:eukaryotic-like serine/threonine-protein kinase
VLYYLHVYKYALILTCIYCFIRGEYMPLEGLQLGHYRLTRLIGSGGMGEVYQAEDTRIARQVAIKVVRSDAEPYPDAQASRETNRLFQREMRAITVLDHPHILPLFDFGEESVNKTTLTYMVMPLRHEGSLTDWLQQRSNAEKLPLQDIAYFIGQAADALQHAHDHQLIHQDVKPSNFLIRNKKDDPNHPDLLLADFGIAKFTTATATASQSIRGTPAFMAPEHWDGQPTAASDQYALAIMAYQLLTGHLPFLGGPSQVMRQHFTAQPQPPSTLNPCIPPALDAVILRAVAKTPSERFPSMTEFSRAFQQATQSTSTATIERTPKTSTSGQAHTPSPSTPTSAGPRTPLPIPPNTSDLHATLAISPQEALTGTTRILTLPGGRKVTVQVPARMPNGSTLRLEGQGKSTDRGTRGTLVVTLMIKRAEDERPQPSKLEERTYLSNPERGFPPSTTPVTSYTPPPSSSFISMPSRASIPSPTSPTHSGQPIQSGKRFSWRRVLLVIGLVVLVVGGGTFYFRSFNYIQRVSLLNEAASNPYSSGGTLALNDPLKDNSNGYFWHEGADSNNGGACTFTGGAYHASIMQQGEFHACDANGIFNNFAYQVQMTIIKGDSAGIDFRTDDTNSTYYHFTISKNNTYELVLGTGGLGQVLTNGSDSSIHAGLGQQNTIAVVANGNTITLYANGHQLANVNDSTYSQGQIGVVAEDVGNPTEVEFRDAKVWTL